MSEMLCCQRNNFKPNERRRLRVILFIVYSMSHHSKKHTFLHKSSTETNGREIRDDWSWEICCSLRPPSQPLSFGYFIRLIRRWGLKCSFTIAPFATIFRVPGRPSRLPWRPWSTKLHRTSPCQAVWYLMLPAVHGKDVGLDFAQQKKEQTVSRQRFVNTIKKNLRTKKTLRLACLVRWGTNWYYVEFYSTINVWDLVCSC